MARIRIDVGGDSSGFHKTMQGVESRLTGLKSKVGFNLGGTLATLAGGATVVAMATNMANFATNVKRSAENLGVTTKRYQELEHVAKRANKEASAFEGIFRNTNKFRAEAQNPGSKQANIADKLGLTQDDLHKGSSDEFIKKALKATAKMSPSEAQNLLTPMLGKGAAGWLSKKDNRDEYLKSTAHTVDDDTIDKMALLKEAFEDLVDVLRSLVMPALVGFAEWLINLVGGYSKGTKSMDDLDREAESAYMAKHGGKTASKGKFNQLALDTGYQMRLAGTNMGGGTDDEKAAAIKALQYRVLSRKYDPAAADEAMKNTKFTAPKGGLSGLVSEFQDRVKAREAQRKLDQANKKKANDDTIIDKAVKKTTNTKDKSILDDELKGAKNGFLNIGGLMGIDVTYRLQRVAEKTNKILEDIYKAMLQGQNNNDIPEPDPD